MYPGSIFNWNDASAITTTEIETVDNSPLYLVVSSFNRGPEKLTTVVGKEFYDLYGSKMNFEKHGQPALQAANMIDGGAKLLVKRVVADDANLANLILVATVKRSITAINTTEDDPDGQTIDEILGREPVEKEYADPLTILSEVGTENNGTKLTVSPAISTDNRYVWAATDDDTMPEKDYAIISAEYTDWDGASEITVVDGTKIKLLEVDSDNLIKKCGIITVVSKIPNPSTVSVAPDTDLEAGVAASREGSGEGTTVITISTAPAEGNEYFYSAVAAMPTQDQTFTAEQIQTDWIRFGSELSKEIMVPDDLELVFVEMQALETDELKAVKGFSIVACSKLPPDTRTSESIDPVIPTEKKYIVASSANTIKWTAVTVENALDENDVKEEAYALLDINDPVITTSDSGVEINEASNYPLIAMTDNGRGVSNKSFRIVADYTTSKEMTNMFYNIQIIEGTNVIEKCIATLNPVGNYNGRNYGLSEDTSIQVRFFNVPTAFDKFLENVADITGIDENILIKYDLINAKNNRAEGLDSITLDPESIKLDTAYGIDLDKGTNGEFGDAPFGTTAWTDAIVKVYTGEFDDAIWDVDTYKIAAIFDANYPMEVKDAMAKFVTFREDCSFFRDFGLEVSSYASIKAFNDSIPSEYKNRYICDYYTNYQVFDPETKRRIKVTMMYDFARAMVKHFANGCYRPLAGVANDMVLDNAIEGTINFTPRITPSVNQKALLDKARINYAIFENGVCVVQSTYTSQADYTQLSFANNVLAIQEVVRAVRTVCPRNRFTFVSGNDFSVYADAVNDVLQKFMSNFAELTFEYEQNDLQALQKIFYATIKFRFNNWAQTESFELYALPTETSN